MERKASTVAEYASRVPADQRPSFDAALALIRRHLPKGYEESVLFGMPSWSVPLKRYPNTYNGQPLMIVSLAAQKNYLAMYLMGVYGHAKTAAAFEAAWKKSGKKLDMGKSCLRFRKFEDLAVDAVTGALAAVTPDDYIAHYEAVRGAAKKPAAKKTAEKKTAVKKPVAKKKAAAKK